MMIVDDEPLVRLALHHLINWQALHIEIVCEAADGVEGLAMLKQAGDIDLLLVDIQMPRMNGIELLKALALDDPALRKRPVPIILSAYSDYSYVREAFLLGAMDYIVKVDMDEEHIIPVMTKAVEELVRLRMVSSASTTGETGEFPLEEREQHAVNQKYGLQIDRDAQLQKLLDVDPKLDAEGFKALSAEAAFVNETNQKAIVVHVAKNIDVRRSHSFIQQTIHTVLHETSIKHELVRRDDFEYVLFCAFPQDRSVSAIREKIHSALTMIQTRLLQYVNAAISVGISDLSHGVSQWHHLYHQARQLARRSYFEGFGKLFYQESATCNGNVTDQMRKQEQSWWDNLKADRLVVLQALKLTDEQQWLLVYERMEKLLQNTKQKSPDIMRAFFIDILWEIGAILYAKGIRLEEVQPTASNPFDEIKLIGTLEEGLYYVKQILLRTHAMIHETNSNNAVRYSTPIANAKRFLDLHYREEVNQTLISEMVGVSESYLSKQFVKEVGCNFIHYLTRLRVEEAKRLLELGIKISDISEKIGYLNPEHFSRMFKKMTGYSPKAYRESLGKA
ncbi:helix-turn-helix domain-containing protein [Paenibacillus sp. SYP-B3998]|nr:helix-turn-helix domain-containing protein [Paenibacillus sp. SYP-B3998]